MGVTMITTDHQIQADEPQALSTGDIDVSRVGVSGSGDDRSKLQTSKAHPDEACLANSVADSGYESPPATPDIRINESDEPEARLQEYASPLRRRLFRPKTKIRAYQIPVPDHIRNRFRDLKLLFDKPLYDHLCKSGARQLPVVITLQYLGEDESSATPWIVVLCDKSVVKSVKQWFRLSSIRSYYCPDDSDLPSFRVLVHDHAPRFLGANVFADDVVGSLASDQTLCGTPIQFCPGSQISHFATLGGLIKVSWQDVFAIYGVTVDHVLHTTQDGLRKLDLSESVCDVVFPQVEVGDPIAGRAGEFQESDASDDDDYELELTDSTYASSDDKGSARSIESKAGSFTYGIGTTFTDGYQSRTKMLDWSLVVLDDVTLYRLNHISMGSRKPISLHTPTSLGCHAGLSKLVWVVSGVSGIQLATVSNAPAYLHLGGSVKFVEAYSLRLPLGAELKPGDSGSWIVDMHSGEVYGQIVASDVFKNAYALPLGDVLKDVKHSLECDSISFPTTDDLTWCMKKVPWIVDPFGAGSLSRRWRRFDDSRAPNLSSALVIPESLRGSCERCHENFLKCARDNSNDSCTECIEAGCPCVSIPVLSSPSNTNLGAHESQHPESTADSRSTPAKSLGFLRAFTKANTKLSWRGIQRSNLPRSTLLQSSTEQSTHGQLYITQTISGRYITAANLDNFLAANAAEFGDWSRSTIRSDHTVIAKRKLTVREINELHEKPIEKHLDSGKDLPEPENRLDFEEHLSSEE